jgi:molybdate transport system substrate-binding protein
VGAASSLQPLLDSIKPGFEDQAGVELHITYAASGALALQIEQGAPIDVFVSAGIRYVDYLVLGGFLRQDSISAFGYGQLVAVYPSLDAGRIPFADAERIAIANPEIAPYGAAAKRLLEAAGMWGKIQDRLVIAGSALQAFQFAKAGEVDYAFVPLPLVESNPDGVERISVSALGLHGDTKVEYPAAIVAATNDAISGQAFIKYLTSHAVRPRDFGYNTVLGPQ